MYLWVSYFETRNHNLRDPQLLIGGDGWSVPEPIGDVLWSWTTYFIIVPDQTVLGDKWQDLHDLDRILCASQILAFWVQSFEHMHGDTYLEGTHMQSHLLVQRYVKVLIRFVPYIYIYISVERWHGDDSVEFDSGPKNASGKNGQEQFGPWVVSRTKTKLVTPPVPKTT